MGKAKINILWIGDAVVPTGFGRVNHGIIDNLPLEDDYDLHFLGVNYWGDPHNYPYKIYPAGVNKAFQDVYGLSRLEAFSSAKFDLIFILNDPWIIKDYLVEIKKRFSPTPRIVTYFPVDAVGYEGYADEWFKDYYLVDKAVAYTEFGYNELVKFIPNKKLEVIPHGVDETLFTELPEEEKLETRKQLFPGVKEFEDAFIILNANRNQPRKRLDIAVEGFSLFAEDKPDVRYYHHAGLKDVGWDISRLFTKFHMNDKLIVSNKQVGVQMVSDQTLNRIYNACDIGLNTSMGEGWGLTAVEHALTGAAQILPEHSACKELFSDVGIMVPVSSTHIYESTLTDGKVVSAEDVATGLQMLYQDRELKNSLGQKAKEKFLQPTYRWQNIAIQWDRLFKELV